MWTHVVCDFEGWKSRKYWPWIKRPKLCLICARISESVFVTSCVCFGLIVSVACSGVMCSCVHSSLPRSSNCVGTGVPWCPCRDHQCTLRCPSRMASMPKRQLCAVLVLRRRGTLIRQSGTVELVMCVLTVMKCPLLLSNGLNELLSRSGSFSQHWSRRNSWSNTASCCHLHQVPHWVSTPSHRQSACNSSNADHKSLTRTTTRWLSQNIVCSSTSTVDADWLAIEEHCFVNG